MIRVLLVPSSDYLGHPFPQRHNQIFERLHDDSNFEVHVARFKLFDKPKLKSKLVIHEIESAKSASVGTYYLLNMVGHGSEIRRIVRQESIDVVVLSNLSSPLAYTLMEELSSIHVPVIFDLPDYYPTSASGYLFDVKSIQGKMLTGIFDYILRYMIKRATIVTAASSALVAYAERVGARMAIHVPNGISEHFQQLHNGKKLREKLGFSQNDIVIGYIGSVEFWLQMDTLIRGLALAKDRKLPVKLLIVGKGLHTGYSKNLTSWISQNDLEADTVWLNFIPYELVPEYMSALDVGTIPFDVKNPTAFYSAPNKMWEYLSQMRPVISTPIPEALNNNDCILIASTPQDYLQQISFISQGGSKIRDGIVAGREKALAETWKNASEHLALTLDTLVNQRTNFCKSKICLADSVDAPISYCNKTLISK